MLPWEQLEETAYGRIFVLSMVVLFLLDTISVWVYPLTLYPGTLGMFSFMNMVCWWVPSILAIVIVASFIFNFHNRLWALFHVWKLTQIPVTIVSMAGCMWWYYGTYLALLVLLMPIVRWILILMAKNGLTYSDLQYTESQNEEEEDLL